MGSIGGSDDQKLAFQERLKRISGAPEQEDFPQQEAVYDTDEVLLQPRRRTPTEDVKFNDWRENIKYPLSFVWVFLGGLAAVWASRYINYHMFMHDALVNGNEAGDLFFMEIGLAFGVSFMFRMMLKVEGKEYVMAQAAGIVIGAGLMHNFVHAYPDMFASIYSPEWVELTLYLTEPSSFFFRGIFFKF